MGLEARIDKVEASITDKTRQLHFLRSITFLNCVSTLGGDENNPYHIWNHTIFILVTEHCNRKLMLKNSSEAMY